jgi:hypothetical protein
MTEDRKVLPVGLHGYQITAVEACYYQYGF